MKFLKNLWDSFIRRSDEFVGWLCGEDTLALTELKPDQMPDMVETDSYESWK